LKMSETLQVPGGGLDVTEEELTQIVLGSLQKLKDKGLVYIQSAGVHYIKGTLTESGIKLVNDSVRTPLLKRVTANLVIIHNQILRLLVHVNNFKWKFIFETD
ncbi:MAG: hypothetical protein KAJ36_09850, partial [Candidatus Thorarchaeota archaeon]|nr:hypothetical protein [Candidatus Thorarchaeota archaeon]